MKKYIEQNIEGQNFNEINTHFLQKIKKKFLKKNGKLPILNIKVNYAHQTEKGLEIISKNYKHKAYSKLASDKENNEIDGTGEYSKCKSCNQIECQGNLEASRKLIKSVFSEVSELIESEDKESNVHKEIDLEISKFSKRQKEDIIRDIVRWIEIQFATEDDYVKGFIPYRIYSQAQEETVNKWKVISKCHSIKEWALKAEELNDIVMNKNSKKSQLLLPGMHLISGDEAESDIKCSMCQSSLEKMFIFLRHFTGSRLETINYTKKVQNEEDRSMIWTKMVNVDPQIMLEKLCEYSNLNNKFNVSPKIKRWNIKGIISMINFPYEKHPRNDAISCRNTCREVHKGYFIMPCLGYAHNECIDRTEDSSKCLYCGISNRSIFTSLWNYLVKLESIKKEKVLEYLNVKDS